MNHYGLIDKIHWSIEGFQVQNLANENDLFI
jgi:hypothetical protein